jgi:hypothetical protein
VTGDAPCCWMGRYTTDAENRDHSRPLKYPRPAPSANMSERTVECQRCKAPVILRWNPPSIATFNQAPLPMWEVAKCNSGHEVRFASKKTRDGGDGLAILNGDLMSWDK